MALTELPGPIIGSIVQKIVDSSVSWGTLRLTCKALSARAAAVVTKLNLQVDADLHRKARRCMQLGFSVDTLYLLGGAEQFPEREAALLALFQLPIWRHLRTLRLRNLDVAEAVVSVLPQACPELQELFLEGSLEDSSRSNSSTPITATSTRQLQHQQPAVAAALTQQLPAVTVSLPRQIDEHTVEVQLCSMLTNTWTKPSSSDSNNQPRFEQGNNGLTTSSSSSSCYASRLATLCSQLQHLRILRLDCPQAEAILVTLCELHQRPCIKDACGAMHVADSNGSACKAEQPLLTHLPLLGWYLFNVTGPPCAGSSSSGAEQASIVQAVTAAAAAPADQSEVSGALSTDGLKSLTSVDTSSSSSNSNSSSPPSHSHSTEQLSAVCWATHAAAAAAAALPQSYQQQQQQQQQQVFVNSEEQQLTGPSSAGSLTRSSSIARRSLDLPTVNSDSSSSSSSTTSSSSADNSSSSDPGLCNGSSTCCCCYTLEDLALDAPVRSISAINSSDWYIPH